VHCFKCGADHLIGKASKSTFCPNCGASITIGDIDIKANTARPIDIRGSLRVRPKATLNHSWIACSDALIEGRLIGTLFCEGRLEWKGTGRVSFGCANRSTHLHAKVQLELLTPLKTGHLDLHGTLHGDVECSGPVVIHKRAKLIGNIQASSIVVEKTAVWVGSGNVSPRETQDTRQETT